MSIKKAIERAAMTVKSRGWDTVYWAIDLHGTCIDSTYTYDGDYIFINFYVVNALRLISNTPGHKIILWSSVYNNDLIRIISLFEKHGIVVSSFNRNAEVENTVYANFDSKFYFNILIDDKAGFDPETDWEIVFDTFNNVFIGE